MKMSKLLFLLFFIYRCHQQSFCINYLTGFFFLFFNFTSIFNNFFGYPILLVNIGTNQKMTPFKTVYRVFLMSKRYFLLQWEEEWLATIDQCLNNYFSS